MQQVENDEEKARVCQVINELAKRTMRGSLSAHWWLPLDSVSFSSIDEVSAGEEEKLYVSAAAFLSHHLDESLLR